MKIEAKLGKTIQGWEGREGVMKQRTNVTMSEVKMMVKTVQNARDTVPVLIYGVEYYRFFLDVPKRTK